MKRKWWYILSVVATAAIFWGCSNGGETRSDMDTMAAPAVPDNTRVGDTTVGRAGDTASYDRMPQKTDDTTHR